MIHGQINIKLHHLPVTCHCRHNVPMLNFGANGASVQRHSTTSSTPGKEHQYPLHRCWVSTKAGLEGREE